MCYTGKCVYEWSSGPSVGECSLCDGKTVPDDALCVTIDKEIERAEHEYRRKHPFGFARNWVRTRCVDFWLRLTNGNDLPF